VVSNGVNADTLIKYHYFDAVIPPQPSTITSFSPTVAYTGSVITITGTNLTGAMAVSFGGVQATSFTVISSTTITAVVGQGASGNIFVLTPLNAVTKPGFVYTTRLAFTSFTPASGPPGTVVTINGINFSPVAANNIVYFGIVKAMVISATPTQLKVQAPYGASYKPIRVNVGGLSAFSNLPFVLTFSGSCNFTVNSFYPKTEFAADEYPTSIGSFDLDGDGKPDIVTAEEGGNYSELYCFRNTSTTSHISFAAMQVLDMAGAYPTGQFQIADLDGDTRPDIVATRIFRNTSTPGNISFQLVDNVYGVAGYFKIDDLDGDGKPDLVQTIGRTLNIFKNTSTIGNISIVAAASYQVENDFWGVEISDIDQDGKKDVISGIWHYALPHMLVYKNTTVNGNISLDPPVYIYTNGQGAAGFPFAGDLNGDGKPDIAIFDTENDVYKVSVLKNTSAGGSISFEDHGSYDVPDEFTDVVVMGDLNGDGKPELAFSSNHTRAFSILLNTTSGTNITFEPRLDYGIEPLPFSYDLTIADINLDGKQDIVTLNHHWNQPTSSTSPTISIFENNVCGIAVSGICAGGNTIINANISGASYQWQQSLDSINFNNISNNLNFGGTQTAALQLNNIPSSWYGRVFRCNVAGLYSDQFALRFTNRWTGSISNAWENPANWSCGTVPDINTDVAVFSGTIVISTNVSVRSIELSANANLTITAGHSIFISH